jgi:hypothetical protein
MKGHQKRLAKVHLADHFGRTTVVMRFVGESRSSKVRSRERNRSG